MTKFTPPDCVSVQEALTVIFGTTFTGRKLPPPGAWREAFSSSRTMLADPKERGRLVDCVHALQKDLYLKKRVACYAGDRGLVDLEPHIFAREEASRQLAYGTVSLGWHGLQDIFLRRPEYVAEEGGIEKALVASDASEPNKSGRPNTSRDAALMYWGMFLQGHEAKGFQWSQAEDAVNAQLERMGLPTVGKTAFREAVREYEPKN